MFFHLSLILYFSFSISSFISHFFHIFMVFYFPTSLSFSFSFSLFLHSLHLSFTYLSVFFFLISLLFSFSFPLSFHSLHISFTYLLVFPFPTSLFFHIFIGGSRGTICRLFLAGKFLSLIISFLFSTSLSFSIPFSMFLHSPTFFSHIYRLFIGGSHETM